MILILYDNVFFKQSFLLLLYRTFSGCLMFLWPVYEPHLPHQRLLFPFSREWSETTRFPAESKGHFNMFSYVPPYWWYTPVVFVYWTEFWVTMTMPSLIMKVSASKHIWTIKERLTVLGCQLKPTYYTHCHLLGDFCKWGDCILPSILLLNINTWLFPININHWLCTPALFLKHKVIKLLHYAFELRRQFWLDCNIAFQGQWRKLFHSSH